MDNNLLQKRSLAYLCNKWDDVNIAYSENYKEISKQVIDFFINGSQLIQPAKAFFVAIVYAKCLEKFFKKDFYESLNDKDLLPDDMFFMPYLSAKNIYDDVIAVIGNNFWKYKSITKTVSYFKREFLICS